VNNKKTTRKKDYNTQNTNFCRVFPASKLFLEDPHTSAKAPTQKNTPICCNKDIIYLRLDDIVTLDMDG
jgi:hypothetical protein